MATRRRRRRCLQKRRDLYENPDRSGEKFKSEGFNGMVAR